MLTLVCSTALLVGAMASCSDSEKADRNSDDAGEGGAGADAGRGGSGGKAGGGTGGGQHSAGGTAGGGAGSSGSAGSTSEALAGLGGAAGTTSEGGAGSSAGEGGMAGASGDEGTAGAGGEPPMRIWNGAAVVAWAGTNWLVGYAKPAVDMPGVGIGFYLQEVTPSGTLEGSEVFATDELDGMREPTEMIFIPEQGYGVVVESPIFAGFFWPDLDLYTWANGHCAGPNVDVRDGRTGFLGAYAGGERIFFDGRRSDGQTGLFNYAVTGLNDRDCQDWSFSFVEDSTRFAALIRQPDDAQHDTLEIAFGADPEVPSSPLTEVPVASVSLEAPPDAPPRQYEHLGLASNGEVFAAHAWDNVSGQLRFLILDLTGAIRSEVSRAITPRRVTPWRRHGSDFELVSEDDEGALFHFVLSADGTISERLIDVPPERRSGLHFGVSPDGQRAVAVVPPPDRGPSVAELFLFSDPGDVTVVVLAP